jgi:hypothetical protein
MQQISEKMKEL